MNDDSLEKKIKELEDALFHAGFDHCTTRGKYNVLLSECIIPRLSDAVDAIEVHNEYKEKGLEEDPALLRIALRRIKLAMKAAEEKVFK